MYFAQFALGAIFYWIKHKNGCFRIVQNDPHVTHLSACRPGLLPHRIPIRMGHTMRAGIPKGVDVVWYIWVMVSPAKLSQLWR